MPSTPRTLPQTSVVAATSVQPTTPISGVYVAPVSTTPISVKNPQVSVPQSGPTIQTMVQMPMGQSSTNAILTSQPQFTYQPY